MRFLAASVVMALIITYLLHRPSNKIMAQWQQPATIAYDSFDPYYFSIVERDIDWKYLPFSWQRHYDIYVGREQGVPGYGHFLEFSFHPGAIDLETHLKASQVEWRAEGVKFNEASGHQLLIPKRMFVGGR